MTKVQLPRENLLRYLRVFLPEVRKAVKDRLFSTDPW